MITGYHQQSFGIENNTLVMFTNDNGAPLKINKPDTPVNGDPGGWDGLLNEPWIGEKRMLSEGRWKYLSTGTDLGFLFDLESDAHETINLISDHPERAADLRAKLGNWTNQFKPSSIPQQHRTDQEAAWHKQYFTPP